MAPIRPPMAATGFTFDEKLAIRSKALECAAETFANNGNSVLGESIINRAILFQEYLEGKFEKNG